MTEQNQDALRCAEVLMYLPAADAKGHAYLSDSSAHIRRLVAENEALRVSVKKANDQAEHFEREFYLRGDRLESATALVQQMLEALEAAEDECAKPVSTDVRAAITAAREWLEKGGAA